MKIQKNLDFFRSLMNKRMMLVALLGFSSGLPIMVLLSIIKIWMRREGADLSSVGAASWIALPYSFNFAWAFLLDRYDVLSIGRRRSWMLCSQIGVAVSMFLLGFCSPSESVWQVVFVALTLGFFSATQDVAIDAYRTEILKKEELGLGASVGVYGYRVGMLVCTAFGLWLVDPDTLDLSFQQMFRVLSSFMLVGLLATLWCAEPHVVESEENAVAFGIFKPFQDMLSRDGAFWVLAVIFLYKLGDSMAASMLGSCYVDLGFSNKTIAEVTKGLGFVSTMAGLFCGGWIQGVYGTGKSLFVFSILQGVTTSLLGMVVWYPTVSVLGFVVCMEDFSSGMGTAALIAFMSQQTKKQFTASQYALLSSLASFGRTAFAGVGGVAVETLGYFNFFQCSACIALPSILMSYRIFQKELED